MRTTDPEIGAREVSRMPTLQCGFCGTYYWDTDVNEALKEIGRNDSPADINEAVRGSECPECGQKQQR